MNSQTDNIIDKLVDKIIELEDYLFDWASCYTGKYTYVDHTNWTNTCMVLFQKYKFDINKIKEDIKNGTILLTHYTNPRIKKLENQLYQKHKENVEKFEKKYFG